MKMNYRIISAFLSVFALIVVASCTYDESDILDGKGQRTVRLQTTGTYYGLFPAGLTAFAPHETKGVVTINRDAISNADLQTTVTVDVSILTEESETMIRLDSAAEANEEDPYFVLPTDSYTLEGVTGTTLTFGPGEAIKELQIKLDPSESYSFSAKYVLGIVLTNVSAPYVLSSSKNTILTTIVLKNIYDGVYQSKGTRFNFSTTGDYISWDDATQTPNGTVASITGPWDFEYPISTVNEKTSTTHAAQLDGGFGTFNITVNDDNTVSIAPNGTTGVTNLKALPGVPSTYDPATGTFDLHYQYTNQDAGGNPTSFRVIHVVHTFKHAQ